MKNLKFWILVCGFGFWILNFGFYLFAQDSEKLVTLTKQIIDAKANEELYIPFEELKDFYFKDNRYSDFVEFLKSLKTKKKALEPFVSYYIALSRYQQLKHLEEVQNWDEYFSQGNIYRDEITESAQKVITSTLPKEPINLYSRLILWKFHQHQESTLRETSLSDLMNTALEYAQGATNIEPIKQIADQLLIYGQRLKSKELYKLYVDKLVTSNIKDEELETIASGFYDKGNLELAEAIYDVYIERLSKVTKKQDLIPILTNIAQAFSYRDEGAYDAVFAEEIFQKIEEIDKAGFNEELIYLRAFNLEKSKEYPKALDTYIDLTQRYPVSIYKDEAALKIGMIYTYILRDTKMGRIYFEKLAQKEKPSPQVISSLYQLGLLSQWKQDSAKAKEYYNILLEKAKGNFQDSVTLTKERLKEIEEAKPIEYNLKTFLDVSLKEEYAALDMAKLDLRSHPYKTQKDTNINISSHPYVAQSGCLQVEIEYLWSGHIGTTKPNSYAAEFNTNYAHPGTKEINLVVVSPSGIIDRNLDFLDIY